MFFSFFVITIPFTLAAYPYLWGPPGKYYGFSKEGVESRQLCAAKMRADDVFVHAMIQHIFINGKDAIRYVTHFKPKKDNFKEIIRSNFCIYTSQSYQAGNLVQGDHSNCPYVVLATNEFTEHFYDKDFYDNTWFPKKKWQTQKSEQHVLLVKFPRYMGVSASYGEITSFVHDNKKRDKSWDNMLKSQLGISKLNSLLGKDVDYKSEHCNMIDDVNYIDKFLLEIQGSKLEFQAEDWPNVKKTTSWRIMSGSHVQSVKTGAIIDVELEVAGSGKDHKIRISGIEHGRRYSKILTEKDHMYWVHGIRPW